VALTLVSVLHAIPDADDPHAIVARGNGPGRARPCPGRAMARGARGRQHGRRCGARWGANPYAAPQAPGGAVPPIVAMYLIAMYAN
jgi:hypothetical protein